MTDEKKHHVFESKTLERLDHYFHQHRWWHVRWNKVLLKTVLYGGLVLGILYLIAVNWYVESETVRQGVEVYLSGIFDRPVSVGRGSFKLIGGVTLRAEDVTIYNEAGFESPVLFYAPELTISMDYRAGDAHPWVSKAIEIQDPEVWIERPRLGEWNLKNLFIPKPEEASRAVFETPIVIEGARLHFFDGDIGFEGAEFEAGPFDCRMVLTSMQDRFVSYFTGRSIPLNGGALDLSFTVYPAEHRTIHEAVFRGIDLDQFRPYYEKFTLFEVESGTADVALNVDVIGDTNLMECRVEAKNVFGVYTESGRIFRNHGFTFAYTTLNTPLDSTLQDLALWWDGSVIRGNGYFTKHRAESNIIDLHLETTQARAEDLLFFAEKASPDLWASGPVQGSYDFHKEGDRMNYDLMILATRSHAVYGNQLNKPSGVYGRLRITGGKNEGRSYVDQILLSLPSSTIAVEPRGPVTRLRSDRLEINDVYNYLPAVPLDRWPRFSGEGLVTLEAEVKTRASSGVSTIRGTVDLTGASIDVEGVFRKKAGDPTVIEFNGDAGPGRMVLAPVLIQLPRSDLSLTGTIAEEDLNLTLKAEDLLAGDITAHLPFIPLNAWRLLSVAGPIAMETHYLGTAGDYHIAGRVDLTNAWVRLEGILNKPPGVAATVDLDLIRQGGVYHVESAVGRLADSTLELTGGGNAESYRFSAASEELYFASIMEYLRFRWVRDYNLLSLSGPSDVILTFSGRPGVMQTMASVDFTRCDISYGDTFAKPRGETLRFVFDVESTADTILLRPFGVYGENSQILLTGLIRRGHPYHLDLRAKAEISPNEARRRIPRLDDRVFLDISVAEIMELLKDENGRVRLEWDAKGASDDPQVALAVQQAVRDSLGKSLRVRLYLLGRLTGTVIEGAMEAVGGVVTLPIQAIGAVVGGETTTVQSSDTGLPPRNLGDDY